MKTSFVRDVRARDVRDIHPTIHRFVVRAGGPSVPSFARHRPHRSRERHRETNERTNRTNRIEANRIHDRPVPRFEIRDSSVERRASRVERRDSSVERRDPHPPPRAHRLAHTQPRTRTDPRRDSRCIIIIQNHRTHTHHPASNRAHRARFPPTPRRVLHHPTPVARAPPVARHHHPSSRAP